MAERTSEPRPEPRARLTGLVYLVFFAFSFATFPRAALIVPGNAAATAGNILAHESLYRLTVASEIFSTATYVAVTLLLYELLKPASRTVSLLAAFFSVVGCAVTAANELNLLAPLVYLGGTLHPNADALAQLQAQALMALRLYGQGYAISLMFFGVYDFLLGCLILRAAFLPRLLGVPLLVAGPAWIVAAFLVVASPALAKLAMPYAVGAGIVSEAALALWLSFAGVNLAKWREQSAHA